METALSILYLQVHMQTVLCAAQVQKSRLQDITDDHCTEIRRDEFQSKFLLCSFVE